MNITGTEWTLRNLFGADEDTIQAILYPAFSKATDYTIGAIVSHHDGQFTVTAIPRVTYANALAWAFSSVNPLNK